MELAFECPTPMLKDIQPLGDFDFALSHLVLQDKDYAEYYKRFRKGRVGNRLSILDNSTNELLEPCSIKDISKAAEIISPHYIVAPDWLGDADRTLEGLRKSIKAFGKIKVFPVAQGGTADEAYEMAKQIRGDFTCIAVPYDIGSSRKDTALEMGKGRISFLARLDFLGFEWIHLLGMTGLWELNQIDIEALGNVHLTMDTGLPILTGMTGMRLTEGHLETKERPTLERMENCSDYRMEDVYFNIAYLRRYTGGIGR